MVPLPEQARGGLSLGRLARPHEHRLEVLAGVAARLARHILRRPLRDDLAAAHAAVRPEVEHPVRRLDHVEVVLDHHHAVALVDQALEFFKAVPRVRDILALLHRVGLDYIHVGQQATTLSGGEAQRVKLAKELSRRSTGQTLYILDEPTTGLHFEDVRKLLEVLQRLVDQGNSVVVIEHNLDVIKVADWILDLGPEGGVRGGEIVAEGTPETVAANPRSYTGGYLKPMLAKQGAAAG